MRTNNQKISLRRDISKMFLFKLAALGIIWALCFSSPHLIHVNKTVISQQIFSSPTGKT